MTTAAVRAARRRIKRIMTTRCIVTSPGGGDVWDPEAGAYIPAEPADVYDGPCRLRMPYAYPQDVNAGDAAWAADTGRLSLPISDPATALVTDGMTVTITENPHDPGMVGWEMTVLVGQVQTDATARRIPVKIITRDVGAPA